MSIKSQTKYILAIVWSRPDRVIRNLFKVIHSVANPQPTPSYSEPGRNWVRLQVSKTGELPMLRARNNVVDFLVRYSSKISEISWALTCHIVHLHLNRWILKDVTLEKVIVPEAWTEAWLEKGLILSCWSVWLGRRRLGSATGRRIVE